MGSYIAKQPDQNGYIYFTDEENQTWQILIERQMELIQHRACPEFIEGLKALDLPHGRVPQCRDVSEKLNALTGWSVVPVEAMISVEHFFQLLVEKKFPAASFIRKREELDYLKEPDIFHELFGHCPLLTHPAYARFLEHYGKVALHASAAARSLLGRLFWFTIEFGLVQTPAGLRIYGGGILSSYEEVLFSLESHEPERKTFDVEETLRTDYNYSVIQKKYFVIPNFNALLEIDLEKEAQMAENIVRSDGESQSRNFITC